MSEELLTSAWREAYPQVLQLSHFVRDLWHDEFSPWAGVPDPAVLLLPHWLGPIFLPQDGEALVHAATLADLFLMSGLPVADQVISRRESGGALKAAAVWHGLLSLARRQLAPFFESRSIFWRYFDLYVEDFFMGLCWEAEQTWETPDLFTDESYLFMGQRLSLLKIGGAALAVAGGKEPDLETLSRSVDRLAVALVLKKNLQHWRQDLAARRVTWVTARLCAHGPQKTWPAVEQILQGNGYLQVILEGWSHCAQAYHDAQSPLTAWPASELQNYLMDGYQRAREQTGMLSAVW